MLPGPALKVFASPVIGPHADAEDEQCSPACCDNAVWTPYGPIHVLVLLINYIIYLFISLFNHPSIHSQMFCWRPTQAQDRGESARLRDDLHYAMDGLAAGLPAAAQRASMADVADIAATQRGRLVLRRGSQPFAEARASGNRAALAFVNRAMIEAFTWLLMPGSLQKLVVVHTFTYSSEPCRAACTPAALSRYRCCGGSLPHLYSYCGRTLSVAAGRVRHLRV